MTVTSDTKDLLRNGIGVCTPLPKPRPHKNERVLALSKTDGFPARVTVWGRPSPESAIVQFNSLTIVSELHRFENFWIRWQVDGVSVSTRVTSCRVENNMMTGTAHGVTVQEGRENIWCDDATRFGVTFADHYITTPPEIKKHLERALSLSTP